MKESTLNAVDTKNPCNITGGNGKEWKYGWGMQGRGEDTGGRERPIGMKNMCGTEQVDWYGDPGVPLPDFFCKVYSINMTELLRYKNIL